MERIAFSRSERTGRWVKARPTGGTCFTITYDRLERLLVENGALRKGKEKVERFEIDEHGVTVFMETADQSQALVIRPANLGPRLP